MSLAETATVERRFEKLGCCILCVKRVHKTENYVEAEEGIAHCDCLKLEVD